MWGEQSDFGLGRRTLRGDPGDDLQWALTEKVQPGFFPQDEHGGGDLPLSIELSW